MGAAQSQDGEAAPLSQMYNPDRPVPPRRPSLGPRPMHPATPVSMRFESRNPAAGTRRAQPMCPVDDRPPVQHSGIVANVVSVVKSSVSLTQTSQGSQVYILEFSFDAKVDGFVTVYYCAQQVIRRVNGNTSPNAPIEKISYVAKGDRLPGRLQFSKGEKKRYRQNVDKGLDVRKYTSAQLQTVEDNYYPIVIRMEAVYPPNTSVPEDKQVKCQTTFATLVPRNGIYVAQVVAQQVLVNGTIYKIMDLYGISGRVVMAENFTDECVICLTEPCDTAVEPCNHLCLCQDCARTLARAPDRNIRKCPVCRSELHRLLHVIPSPSHSESEPSDTPTQAAPS